MGLDMYLYKTKRVEGLTSKDYREISSCVYEKEDELRAGAKLQDLLPEIKGAEIIQEAIAERGTHIHWLSILEEIGYWRKANAIHGWFVQNCQGGIDECQLSDEVTEEKIEELLKLCNEVLDGTKNPKRLLPTQSGFFFGSTNYDEWYLDDIRNTIEILSEVLENTDFETEIIFYNSSW